VSPQKAINLADQVLSYATHKGIMHLYTQNEVLDGRTIEVNNSALINFGSCSYLGLERDSRIVEACMVAAQRFGTQFSSSRAYMSTSQYLELEAMFTQLFAKPCLVTPTTSLGHLAALPALIRPGDLLVLDHQVHASVNQASRLLKAQGESVDMIRHNDLDRLEQLVQRHRQKRRRIWYCIDGVYSMYGDLAPIDDLYRLMDRYPELMLYADDAHGMSWCGRQGRGSIRGVVDHHPQLVLAASLNKAFGCAGGLLVFPDMEMKRRVRTCGGPLVFSGPIQPPMLGAAIASAEMHLTGEVERLQQQLAARIRHCRHELEVTGLPDVAESDSPVFFIGTGEINAGVNLIHRLHMEGYYVNAGIFPAVPIHNMGVRFTVTNHVTEDDISGLVRCMAHHYPLALAEENVTSNEVAKAFKMPDPRRSNFIDRFPTLSQPRFTVSDYSSINEIESLWRDIPDFHGTVSFDNVRILEQVFAASGPKSVDSQRWWFHYLVINDEHQQVVAVAMLTLCDIKSDMFSSPELSALAEERRSTVPNSFVSRTLMLGTPITEGRHLYIDSTRFDRDDIHKAFFKKVKSIQLKFDAELLVLRDFPKADWDVKVAMSEGFLIQTLPDTHRLTRTEDFGEPSFLRDLNQKHRANWRKQILPFIERYRCLDMDEVSDSDLDRFYQLYRYVQKGAREISTFPLPISQFRTALDEGVWRCLALEHQGTWVGCIFYRVESDRMYPMVIGMDPVLKSQGIYRAALYYIGRYARANQLKIVYLGFTASVEKRRIGAEAIPTVALIRVTNSYQFESLDALSAGKNR